jgi:hypothetical protein
MTGAIWCVLLAIAALGIAQTERETWVAGRLAADADKSWNVGVPVGIAGGVSAGLELTRRISVELAFEWPATRTIQTVRTYQEAMVGPVRITQRDSYQSPGGAGFVAIHVLTRSRLRLTLLAGLGLVSHRSTYDGLQERLDPNGNVVSRVEGGVKGTFNWGGPAAGVELSIRLATHVALVPEVHVIWFPISDTGPSTAIMRPAVGVRWTF